MQIIPSIFVSFISFIILILTYYKLRVKDEISVIDYFIFFFLLQFGPHSWFAHSLKWNTDKLAPGSLSLCNYGISLSYLALSIGFYIGSTSLIPWRHQQNKNINIPLQKYNLIPILTIIYVLFFLIVAGDEIRQMLTVYIAYIKNTSTFTYNEIRRSLFNDDILAIKLLALTRYSVTPIFFSLLFAISTEYFRQKKAIATLCLISISVIIFIISAIQLNKLVYIYYFLLAVLTVFHVNLELNIKNKIKFNFNVIKKSTKLLLSITFLLFFLVYIQYRDNFTNIIEIVSYTSSLLLYRIFISNNDDLSLWFDAYPERIPFTGYHNVSKITSFLGVEYQDPTIDIPHLYLGDVLTTMQPGFIASSYASYGFTGIVLFSILVGIIIICLTKLKFMFHDHLLRASFVATMGLNTYFLTSSQFHTCLLSSGGLIVAPVIYKILYFFLRVKW